MTKLDTTAPSHDYTQSDEDTKHRGTESRKSDQFSASSPHSLLVIYSALNLNTHYETVCVFSLLEFDL